MNNWLPSLDTLRYLFESRLQEFLPSGIDTTTALGGIAAVIAILALAKFFLRGIVNLIIVIIVIVVGVMVLSQMTGIPITEMLNRKFF